MDDQSGITVALASQVNGSDNKVPVLIRITPDWESEEVYSLKISGRF